MDCTYCFYLKKQEMYPWSDNPSLTLETFEIFLKGYIPLSAPHLTFLWQGGEPTIMGLQFFDAAMELERKVARGMLPTAIPHISNAIQTNGTLLTQEWAKFFKKWRFLVGVSLDGPQEWHDRYRIDPIQRKTHSNVMEGIKHLEDFKVPFNILVVVNQANVKSPEQLLRWLVDQGFKDLQFIPCAEMKETCQTSSEISITDESITPDEYAQFLDELFNTWLKIGVDKIRIRLFDNIFQTLWGFPSEMCQFAAKCGYLVLEHNGDCYPCDFQVSNEWFLGNVHNNNLEEIVQSEKFLQFSNLKSNLHPDCQECPWRNLCFGECPSYRTIHNDSASHSLPYFCKTYKDFFSKNYEKLEDASIKMAKSLGFVVPTESLPADRRTKVKLQIVKDIRVKAETDDIGRNASCPCGSGRKFKRCCGAFNIAIDGSRR